MVRRSREVEDRESVSEQHKSKVLFLLQNHIIFLSRKRELINKLYEVCSKPNYTWYICTFHVYKKVKPKVAKRLARLSYLTDQLRKYFVPVKRTMGSRQRIFEVVHEADKDGYVQKNIIVSEGNRRNLTKMKTLYPQLIFTKEINEDFKNHYHGIIGIPIDDWYRSQEFPRLKNYVLWKEQSEWVNIDYIKYIFKYMGPGDQKYVDYYLKE